MSKIKHAAESAGNAPSVGRIAPLNMASEKSGLNYDSLISDMETAIDGGHKGTRCSLWA